MTYIACSYCRRPVGHTNTCILTRIAAEQKRALNATELADRLERKGAELDRVQADLAEAVALLKEREWIPTDQTKEYEECYSCWAGREGWGRDKGEHAPSCKLAAFLKRMG